MADRFPEITSAEEFIRLRQSEDPAEFKRSGWATLPLPVWWDLVRNHPDIEAPPSSLDPAGMGPHVRAGPVVMKSWPQKLLSFQV
ncbi:hypothetical protein ACFYPZ_29725 [Streptomyces sp. NPDC005506]|uniref:hypothetical protein n=1 Tax=unclassified Streptomyces TaxID=2593676 RepID=UPI0036C09331